MPRQRSTPHRPEDTSLVARQLSLAERTATTTAAAAVPVEDAGLSGFCCLLLYDRRRAGQQVTALAPLTEAALGDERPLRIAQLVNARAVQQGAVEVGHVRAGGPRRLCRQSSLAAGELHGQGNRCQPSQVVAGVLNEDAERSAHSPAALRDGEVEEGAGILQF